MGKRGTLSARQRTPGATTKISDMNMLEPWQLLANAVVQQACEDIVEYWTCSENNRPRYQASEHDRTTAEAFLRSEDLIFYTKLDGEYLLRGLEERIIEKFHQTRKKNAEIEAEPDRQKRKAIGAPIVVSGWRIIAHLNAQALSRQAGTGEDVEIYCDNCGKSYFVKDIENMKKRGEHYRFDGPRFLCPLCVRRIENGTVGPFVNEGGGRGTAYESGADEEQSPG